MMKNILFSVFLVVFCLKICLVRGQELIEEKAELHLDRELYMAGDVIWAKVYLRDALIGRPSTLSKVVQVELWDANGNMIVQRKPLMDGGHGNVSIEIPETQPGGYYQVRAYSRWMGRAPVRNFASKIIRVFNPNQTLPVSENQDLAERSTSMVGIFPEGGSLLHAIETRIGIQIRDDLGRPKSVIGRVEQMDGTVVAAFQTNDQGLADIHLSPDSTQSYGLRIVGGKDSSKVYALPKTVNRGAGLKVEFTEQGSLGITAYAIDIPSPLSLKLYKAGWEVSDTKLDLTTGSATHNFSADLLPKGEYVVRLESENGEIWAYRYIWFGEPEVMDLSLNVSKDQVRRRKKMRVDIQCLNQKGEALDARLGISIVKKAPSLGIQRNRDFTDLAMLVRGKPQSGDASQWEAYPELYGLSLSGKILNFNVTTQSPARVVLSFPGKTPFIRTTMVNDAGRFNFRLAPIFGVREIGLLAVDAKGNPLKAELDPVFLGETPYPYPLELRFEEDELAFLREHMIQQQILAAYRDTLKDFTEPEVPVMKPFYGFADKVYKLDEYTRFDTEETFNEIVYSVALRKRRGRYFFRVFNEETSELMREKPLVLFDGIPLEGAGPLLKINSKRIEKIEVVSTRYEQDKLRLYGIVSVTTFKGDAEIENLPGNFIRRAFTCLSAPRKYNPVSYENADETRRRIPDQRSLLAWQPMVQTDDQGNAFVEFYTSDVIGTYEIRVSGLSENGLWGEARAEFVVEDMGQ